MSWTVRIFDSTHERIWWSLSKLLPCCYSQKCHTKKSKLTSHWPFLSGILGDNWVLRYIMASVQMIKITVNKISRICITIRYEILQAGNQCSAGRRSEICFLPKCCIFTFGKKRSPIQLNSAAIQMWIFFFPWNPWIHKRERARLSPYSACSWLEVWKEQKAA